MDLRQAQIRFFKKFAHLYDSGVPLAEAVQIASAEAAEPLHGAIARIVEDLYRGTGFADSMASQPDAFGPDLVGVIRAGEARGELGDAARNAASGLTGNLLAAREVDPVEMDLLLESAGDARVVHLEPGGRVRIRTSEGLSDGGEADTVALGGGLARRAGIETGTGEGAFLWNNRLVRVAIAETSEGPSTVVRLSAEPGAEPEEARAWREGRPGLLLVLGGRHADKDCCLRSILAAFDPETCKRVAVGLPVPEALEVGDIGTALEQDPDVLCLAEMRHLEEGELLALAVEDGI
ncbi:MAG: type II secretion system F family protein, partial [Planctomycetota bacterium]